MDWFLARYSLQLLELRPSRPGAQPPPDDTGVSGARIGSLIWKSSLDVDTSSKWCQRAYQEPVPAKKNYMALACFSPASCTKRHEWQWGHLPSPQT